jgi:hypothetical protein
MSWQPFETKTSKLQINEELTPAPNTAGYVDPPDLCSVCLEPVSATGSCSDQYTAPEAFVVRLASLEYVGWTTAIYSADAGFGAGPGATVSEAGAQRMLDDILVERDFACVYTDVEIDGSETEFGLTRDAAPINTAGWRYWFVPDVESWTFTVAGGELLIPTIWIGDLPTQAVVTLSAGYVQAGCHSAIGEDEVEFVVTCFIKLTVVTSYETDPDVTRTVYICGGVDRFTFCGSSLGILAAELSRFDYDVTSGPTDWSFTVSGTTHNVTDLRALIGVLIAPSGACTTDGVAKFPDSGVTVLGDISVIG